MLDLLRRGKIGKDEPCIFLHTGGAPALFAYPDELGTFMDGNAPA
jgi:1-aminocyclopropane-1-carboxylate deaminase/D-cysteine desulfhydrase-like pyridoxal-dependent ACC family enzyme